MIRLGARTIVITTITTATFCAGLCQAQTLRLRSAPPHMAGAQSSSWSESFAYGVSTDYADARSPRGYTHSLGGSLAYSLDEHWSLGLELGLRAETLNGQIPKEAQQSTSETVSPSSALEVDYAAKILGNHKYLLFLHGEPLWDEASRLEGYKGLYGAGGEVTFNFFHKIYSMAHSLDATGLANSYPSALDTTTNPDYFYTYKWVNALHFWGSYRVAYKFGTKVTRYLDGFWGYAYSNSVSLTKSWGSLSVALAYSNGGFTDDGQLSLWYIDQYRRIGQLVLNYAF